jgi:hypothetical protein
MNRQQKIPSDNGIEEPYWFSKDKIGRELGYPLKRSLLDSALYSASVYATVYSVRYLGHRNSNVVLDAGFNPEWRGRPTVRGGCLPILCRWLAKTRSEGNVWRGTEHMLNFEIQDGSLRHTEDTSR